MNINGIVALSNAPAILALVAAHRTEDLGLFLCLLNVTLASVFSHLFECHKHGMPGNGLSPRVSYLLNRWDVVGCVLFGFWFIQKYVTYYGMDPSMLFVDGRWMLMLTALIGEVCLRISEYDKYNAARKHTYVVFHCAWHILIFVAIQKYIEALFYFVF